MEQTTRKQRYEQYLNLCVSKHNPRMLEVELANLMVGQPVSEDYILKAMEHIHVRKDCGDFRIIEMLRMFYRFPDSDLMTQATKDEMKYVLLDYDYWFDKNNKFPGNQIIWTENHIFIYMLCEYLATKYYPEETFRMRGKKGKEITASLKPKLMHWMDMKLKVGFSEWDSNCYIEENIASLLNLYDLSGDDEIKAKAKALLDVCFFSVAVNSYQDNHCCSHGRSYTEMLLDHNHPAINMLQRLLWGKSPISVEKYRSCFAAICLIDSDYAPAPIIDEIAMDTATVLEDKEQQSFDVEDAHHFGYGYETYNDMTLYWHNMAYTHLLVVDKMYEMCEHFGIMVNPAVYPEYRYVHKCLDQGITPDLCRCPNYMPRLNKVTYRTPDYMLSCAQNFRKGELGFQQHIWQLTLAEDALVFTSHPGTLETRTGRPDLWCGNYLHPNAVQHKDTVICIYDITADCPVPYTHAYFPLDKFDQVANVGQWHFGRKADGYVALYSQHPTRWGKDYQDMPVGPGETRLVSHGICEIICDARKNVWVCQAGNKAEYGSFEGFISKVLAAPLAIEGLTVSYTSPTQGIITYGWDAPLIVDGQEVAITGYKRFDNLYCQSEYLSGKYELTYGGKTHVIE